jgi:hypothetical protein
VQALAALAKTVGVPVAYRLLGQAFAVGPWFIPLAVVAELAPQVVIRFADALYVDDRQRDIQTDIPAARSGHTGPRVNG